MKQLGLVILVFILFGFIVETKIMKVTDGSNSLKIYIENDTAFIKTNLPLIIDAPNTVNVDSLLEDMQKQINDLADGGAGFKDGLYFIADTLN